MTTRKRLAMVAPATLTALALTTAVLPAASADPAETVEADEAAPAVDEAPIDAQDQPVLQEPAGDNAPLEEAEVPVVDTPPADGPDSNLVEEDPAPAAPVSTDIATVTDYVAPPQEVIFPADTSKRLSQHNWIRHLYWDKQYNFRNGNTPDSTVRVYSVYSPSMKRAIPVVVIPARNAAGERVDGAPTLYHLNGAGGAEQGADWISQDRNFVNFYKNREVNVVLPMAGAFSYYFDWLEEPTNAGRNHPYYKGPQKWETFLTKELPGPIERELNAGTGRGIVGFSMSATSSLVLAQHNPELYHAVGSYSGCASVARPISNWFHSLTLDRANATTEQVWGEVGSPYNLYHDGLLHADKLEGMSIYVSNGSGLAGETDSGSYRMRQPNQDPLTALRGSATVTIEGGVIEAATNSCTHDLKAKLDSHNIPATFKFRNTGTHSWPSWRQDIIDSWPTLNEGLRRGNAEGETTRAAAPVERPTGPDAGTAPEGTRSPEEAFVDELATLIDGNTNTEEQN